MAQCSKCSDGTTQDARYLCHTRDYRVVDSSDNVLLNLGDHGIPSDDSEIGDSLDVNYCSCGNWWT